MRSGVNARRRAQWFTTQLLTKVIKSFSWLMATSPPQGESKCITDACAALIFTDATLIWLIYSNLMTVWDNHHVERLWANIHPPNHRDENHSRKQDNSETEINEIVGSSSDTCRRVTVGITMYDWFNLNLFFSVRSLKDTAWLISFWTEKRSFISGSKRRVSECSEFEYLK